MMESSHLDQAENSSPETFSDSSISPDSPTNNDIFGDPLVHPRVGDEYQVEIPSILSKSEDIDSSSQSFFSGLPIPVMWARNRANPVKTERPENLDDCHAIYTNGFVESENLAEMQTSSNMKELVPGKKSEVWTDFEADCFLLGLYMLGKNLLQVTRFVGSKGIGQMLAYYYGQFYASERYSRWSECRKMRSRKCVVGHGFFTGYRQQELFSRLFPRLSEESKTKLLEVSRAFAEGSNSLDEYVFTLKTVVGIHVLVDVVGIGKGKEDLTTLIFDGSKNNQILAHRPEVPSGKACSALTRAEIVKYLTGDFRLSKARSNDLFWEAVWPRLLARGWHSEQPRGDGIGYKGSNHLVFLMPGIKKFSRRKLSKGDHYFDSVSDVLAKVASEPELVELEADETNPSCSKGENGWSTKVKSDDDDQDSSDHERHCYLKPRVSLGLSDLTKFTIVDTSLANEDNPNKVWELRSLPVEADSFLPTSHNPMNHKPRAIKHKLRRGGGPLPVSKKRRLSSCVDIDVTFVLSLPARNRNATLRIVGPKLTSENVLVSDNHTHTHTDEKSVEDCSSGKRVDLNLPPESDGKVKLEEEASCSNQNSHVEKIKHFDVEKKPHFDSGIRTSSDNMDAVCPSHNMEPRVNSASREPSDTVVESDNVGPKVKSDNMEPQVKSDNMELQVSSASGKPSNKVVESDNMEPRVSSANMEPQVKSDIMELRVSSASGEPSNKVVESDNMEPRLKSDHMEPRVRSANMEPANKVVKCDQQPRRQSTRSRPLTTKALEALEIDLFSPVRKYRKRSSSMTQDQKPKRSRQPRDKSPHDMVSEMRASEETCNGKTDMVGPPPIGGILNEKGNMTHELLKLS